MIPPEVRELLEAPNYVHLSTLRKDGSPRNWVVWAGLEDDRVLICTTTHSMKATHMRRDPRVGLSLVDLENPYRMASLQGRVVEVRDDEGCAYMDPISVKYTGEPFPSRGSDRLCFVVEIDRAWQTTLAFVHDPAESRNGS
jgi:PPOX class probable F420-dependent enzyme